MPAGAERAAGAKAGACRAGGRNRRAASVPGTGQGGEKVAKEFVAEYQLSSLHSRRSLSSAY